MPISRKVERSEDDPRRIQNHIAPVSPPPTMVIQAKIAQYTRLGSNWPTRRTQYAEKDILDTADGRKKYCMNQF